MVEKAIDITKITWGSHSFAWTALGNGDTGAPINPNNGGGVFTDKTVQVSGTFGAGGSINIEGSNDGTNWFILTDPLGNALTFTSAGLEAILENPLYIRPNVTGGDGTTSLAVILNGRANIQLR